MRGMRYRGGILAGGVMLSLIAAPTIAGEIEILRSPGVDAVTPQGPLDSQIVGRWAIGIPSVQTPSGASPGASMGLMVIDAEGNYAWRSEGRALATGTVQQVHPRRDAVEGKTYWLVSNGDEAFYLTSAPHGLTLYSLRTNMVVAYGKPL